MLVARGRCSFVLSSDVDIWFTSDEAKTELTQKKYKYFILLYWPPLKRFTTEYILGERGEYFGTK